MEGDGGLPNVPSSTVYPVSGRPSTAGKHGDRGLRGALVFLFVPEASWRISAPPVPQALDRPKEPPQLHLHVPQESFLQRWKASIQELHVRLEIKETQRKPPNI